MTITKIATTAPVYLGLSYSIPRPIVYRPFPSPMITQTAVKAASRMKKRSRFRVTPPSPSCTCGP